MKKANLILAGLIALTMSGCVDVPEDVKSRTEEKQSIIEEAESTAAERTGELVYISPGEANADAEAGLAQKYSNITLAEGIKAEVPETIVKCDFRQVDGYISYADKMYERVFGKETAESHPTELWGDDDDPNSPLAPIRRGSYDEDMQFLFRLDNAGWLYFNRGGFYSDGSKRIERQRAAIYHVDRGDDLSDTYDLSGKTVSIAEAAEAAQKWLDENYADLEPQYDVRVRTVIARQSDNGEYSLEVIAYCIYKGIALSEMHTVFYNDPDNPTKVKYRNYKIEMHMINGTDIDKFSNSRGIIVPEEKGTLDKIVSLKSALEHIEKTFADFENPLEISDINLKYIMTPEYDPELSPWADWFENVHNTGRIVWEFVIDVPMEAFLRQDDNGEWVYRSKSIGDPRRYIYIDAETGELEFDFTNTNYD